MIGDFRKKLINISIYAYYYTAITRCSLNNGRMTIEPSGSGLLELYNTSRYIVREGS